MTETELLQLESLEENICLFPIRGQCWYAKVTVHIIDGQKVLQAISVFPTQPEDILGLIIPLQFDNERFQGRVTELLKSVRVCFVEHTSIPYKLSWYLVWTLTSQK